MVFGGAGERRGFAGAVWAPGFSQRFRSRVVPLHSSPERCRDLHRAWPRPGGLVNSAAATETGSSWMGKGREGKGRRARQLRVAEKVFHGSYLQPSKELQRLPIKTLLKHF